MSRFPLLRYARKIPAYPLHSKKGQYVLLKTVLKLRAEKEEMGTTKRAKTNTMIMKMITTITTMKTIMTITTLIWTVDL
jgi:hypothetical protein